MIIYCVTIVVIVAVIQMEVKCELGKNVKN